MPAHLPAYPYVAKCDDDVYVVLSELEAQLGALAGRAHVYMGRLYWTTWDADHHVHGISKFGPNAS